MLRVFFILTMCLQGIFAFAQNIEDTKTNDTVEKQVINHTGYKVSYNQIWCIPNWVAYELAQKEVEGTNSRRGSFCPDPKVIGYTAETSDYSKTGWDRGHMVPTADLKWSKEVMLETFYLSNICPQNRGLNGGIWLSLEERVRYWAKKDGSIFIVCGPIMKEIFETIGSNGVAIPSGFFKVLCKKYKGKYTAIGFVFPNENCSGDIFDYSCAIDKVEQVTGHDFFYILPDDIENIIEGSINLKDWN